MAIYQDFVGLNTLFNQPVSASDGSNTLGYPLGTDTGEYFNPNVTSTSLASHYFNGLNVYRNGPYGSPMWKQIRAGQNHLTRNQILNNTFTYVTEPGTSRDVTIGGRTNQITDRYGAINVFTEPVVNASHKPLELYGGVSVYDSTKDEEIKHSVRFKDIFR